MVEKRITDNVPNCWDIYEEMCNVVEESHTFVDDVLEYPITHKNVMRINSVSGLVGGNLYVFKQGEDYFYRDKKIVFVDCFLYPNCSRPDNNTEMTFNISLSDKSSFHYLDSYNSEFGIFWERLDDIQKTKWVDSATETDLEKIASLYDLKRELGETDNEFRLRIKATIPNFVGGGTKAGIFEVVYQFTHKEPEIIDGVYPAEFHIVTNASDLEGVNIQNILNEIDISKAAGVVYTFEIIQEIEEEIIPIDVLNFYVTFNLNDDSYVDEHLNYSCYLNPYNDILSVSETDNYSLNLNQLDSVGNIENFYFGVSFSVETVNPNETINFDTSYSDKDEVNIDDDAKILTNLDFKDSVSCHVESVEFNTFKAIVNSIEPLSVSDDLGIKVHTAGVDDILIWDGGPWTGYWDEGHKWSDNV